MDINQWFFPGLGGLGATVTPYTTFQYWQEMQVIASRLEAGSQVLTTAHSQIEYADQGSGPTVLVLHGGGGGYDQGLLLARLAKDEPLRCIAPSRFGYLRTPMPASATPADQADACAALLDELGITQVGVMSLSAGGLAALQFVLRYPQRCWGLVMVSSICQPLSALPAGLQMLYQPMPQADFLYWLWVKTTPETAFALNGVDPALLNRIKADEEKMTLLQDILNLGNPISQRTAGFINDMELTERLDPALLTSITTPTLVIHGIDDPVVPFAQSKQVAQTIPGAKLLALSEGGHFCFATHQEEVGPAVVEFLRRHTP